jgi:hypothetical protein
VGTYNIRAALPSPYINVLCANVQKQEISALVYETALNRTLNATADLYQANYTYQFDWTNSSAFKTPVDNLFGWGPNNPAPVFYKFPLAFNTVCGFHS